MAAPIKISVINSCTVLSDAQINAAVKDIQTQITRDFAPVWGVTADLVFVPKKGAIDPNSWQVPILDTSDEAGALGYHDITANGMPLGKVFAKTDLLYGYSWSVTMSHEILEMLADPDCIRTVFVQTTRGGKIYAYEVCDPCEDDSQGYRIGNTLVSDFVFPAYFETTVKPGRTQMDQRGLIKRPYQILQNGYLLCFDIKSGAGWTYVTGDSAGGKIPFSSRARIGSRREKRIATQELWVPSKSLTHAP